MPLIDIPGGKATLREPGKVKAGARDDLDEALVGTYAAANRLTTSPEGETDKEKEARILAWAESTGTDDRRRVNEFNRLAVATFLESWTLDKPIPTTADEVRDLDADVAAALNTAVAPLVAQLFDVSKFSVEQVTDPNSPTEPSPG